MAVIEKPNQVQIDTGEVSVEFVDRFGNHRGAILFNPSDLEFVEKFYSLSGEFQVKLLEYREKYKQLKEQHKAEVDILSETPLIIKDDTTVSEGLILLRETVQYMRDKIDYLFGSGASDAAFGKAYSIEAIGQFFDGMTPYISSFRLKAISKYTPDKNQQNKGKRQKSMK